MPDGLLEFDDQKPIAIELELSAKGWRRLGSIVADYAANLDIGEVWYFTNSGSLHRRLQRVTEGYSFIKIHHLPRVTGQPDFATARRGQM